MDANINSIIAGAFRPGNHNAMGIGIYFARHSGISRGYAGGLNKMILARVLPGRIYGQGTNNQQLPPGFDSFADDKTRRSIVVVPSGDQTLPLYIVHYQ